MSSEKRSKLIKSLDKEFSRYIRKVHSKRGLSECFTCLWIDDWDKMDCGHYMSRKHMLTRWDPDNARPQCVRCNRFHHGQPESFKLRLGEELSTKLEQEAKQTCKWEIHELEEMLETFKKLNRCLKH